MMASALARGHEVAARRLAMSTTYLAVLTAPLVAFGVVFADGIIGLLYGAKYEPASFAFACCLAAGAVGVLSQGASSYLLGSDRQRTLMIVVLAGSLVKVALDVGLIQRYGLTGAVGAYGPTRVLMGLAVIGLALYHRGARLEWSRRLRALSAAAPAAAAPGGLEGGRGGERLVMTSEI